MARIVSRYLTPRGFVLAGDRLSYTYRDTISYYMKEMQINRCRIKRREICIERNPKHEDNPLSLDLLSGFLTRLTGFIVCVFV